MIKIRKKIVSSDDGFTLIELLVIIAVLGILAALSIPKIGGLTNKAKLTEAQAAISSVRIALEMIYTDKNSYNSANTGDYKTAADLLAETDIDEYLDNISNNWQYNITAVTDNYLIEVIGNGDSYPNTLKASLAKGDNKISTTTTNNSP